MSQLRTHVAKVAAAKIATVTGATARSAKRTIINSGVSQSLPPKEILRQLRSKRLIVRS